MRDCLKVLPRRAFLGVELPADEVAFTAAGLRIAAITPGGMADRAGVRAGDTITAVACKPVHTLAELGAALRAAGTGTTTRIDFSRDGVAEQREVGVTACAYEQLDEAAIVYGELAAPGARLRTIFTHCRGPRAVILLVQGVACETVEADPIAGIAHGLARARFDTLRFDKRGVGDSDGGPCDEADFATELADARLAFDLAARHARDRRVPLVIFGHSVGAIIAAELAGERPIDGAIVYGAPVTRWLACLIDTTRRQLAMRGASSAEIEEAANSLAARALADGLNGRSADYHRQLDAIDPAVLWSRVLTPILVVRGEHDWVVDPDDQARIAELVPELVTIIDVPGIDHLLGRHADREASLRDYGSGPFDPEVVQPMVEWIDRL